MFAFRDAASAAGPVAAAEAASRSFEADQVIGQGAELALVKLALEFGHARLRFHCLRVADVRDEPFTGVLRVRAYLGEVRPLAHLALEAAGPALEAAGRAFSPAGE